MRTQESVVQQLVQAPLNRVLALLLLLMVSFFLLSSNQAQAAITYIGQTSGSVATGATTTVAYRGEGGQSNANGGNITLPMPGGLNVGDLLLCLVESHDAVVHTYPAGWTKLYDRTGAIHRSSLAWRFVTSGSNPSITITHSGGNSIIGDCVAYVGVDTSDPFYSNSFAAADSASDLTVETGSLPAQSPDALYIFTMHIANNPSAVSVTTTGDYLGLNQFTNQQIVVKIRRLGSILQR